MEVRPDTTTTWIKPSAKSQRVEAFSHDVNEVPEMHEVKDRIRTG